MSVRRLSVDEWLNEAPAPAAAEPPPRNLDDWLNAAEMPVATSDVQPVMPVPAPMAVAQPMVAQPMAVAQPIFAQDAIHETAPVPLSYSGAQYQMTGDFTYMVWARPTQRTKFWVRLFGKGNYGLWISSSGRARAQIRGITSGGDVPSNQGGPIIPLNEWTHICGRFSKDRVHELYINGVLDTSLPTTGTPATDEAPLTIGSATSHDVNSGMINLGFIGYLDDARLYDRALTDGEIMQIGSNGSEFSKALMAAVAQPMMVPASVPKLYDEVQSLREIGEAFGMLDGIDVSDGKISRDEFKKGIANLDLHAPEGTAPGWKDDAFDRFDVDKDGHVSYEELCFAIGMSVMSAKQRGEVMSAKECLSQVIFKLQETQTAAKLKAMKSEVEKKDVAKLDEGRRADAAEAAGTAAAAKAKVDVGSTELEEWEDSPEAYCGLILVPCCLCCYTIGATDMDDKIEGMEAAIKYITTNKDQNPGYYWSIQNYHHETRTETSTDANGNTTTHTTTVRVNTHFASTAGMLQANDVSETFVPNTRLKNCALASKLNVNLHPSFHSAYEHRRSMFYRMNTTDICQDHHESFSLSTMRKAVRIQWISDGGEDPWWVGEGIKCLSIVTWTAVCWFHAMKKFMGAQSFTFQKQATGWA